MTDEDERERVRAAVDRGRRSHDYPLPSIPAYQAWSARKLEEGESDALIAHLDATCMSLVPEDVDHLTDADFDELLDDLKHSVGDEQNR